MATIASPRYRQWRIRRFVRGLVKLEWAYLALGILVGIVLNRFIVALAPENIGNFLNNLVPEVFGMVFTILILDRLDSARQQYNTREQLVRRAHSRNNPTALSAIEELRVMGELEVGILAGRELRGANWQDANLYKADLRGTDLSNAILYKADFVLANLTGANITPEQMASLDCLYDAIMPDGRRYDGRYNLAGDYAHAKRSHVDPGSPEEMARWYGVTLEQYLRGQDWAVANLPRFRRRSTHYDFEDMTNHP